MNTKQPDNHERLKAELERVQKQSAVLRGALVRLCNSWAEGTERENYEAMKEAKAAILGDVGREFIPREQVKPLIEALKHCLESSSDPPKFGRFLTKEDREIIRSAIAHARTLGL